MASSENRKMYFGEAYLRLLVKSTGFQFQKSRIVLLAYRSYRAVFVCLPQLHFGLPELCSEGKSRTVMEMVLQMGSIFSELHNH